MKHTAGKWRVDKRSTNYLIEINTNGYHVAAIRSNPLDLEQDEANAKLIATAPEMLAKLEELTKAFRSYAKFTGEGDAEYCHILENECEMLIKKARGS